MKRFNSFMINLKNASSMIKQLKNSVEKENEVASDICSENGKNALIIRNVVYGDSDSVMPLKKCKKDESLMGGFHTHLSRHENDGLDIPSLSDIREFVKRDSHIMCIGGEKTKKISCYTRKSGFSKDLVNRQVKRDIGVIEKMGLELETSEDVESVMNEIVNSEIRKVNDIIKEHFIKHLLWAEETKK